MFTAALLAIAGTHLLVFGVLAKLYTHHVDPVFVDPRVTAWLQHFTVERGILYGLGLLGIAAALAVPIFIYWLQTMEVASPARWIFAGALAVIGLEVIFAAFLVGIMEQPRERNRQG
jgi:hypothetical protein